MKMQKKQFRIGQLAQALGVERFVVRFWEKEFKLNSYRSHGGQRFYEEKDLMKFHKIKKLLYEEGFTIAGAKKQLKQNNRIIASKKTTIESITKKTLPHKDFSKKMKSIQSKLKALQQWL